MVTCVIPRPELEPATHAFYVDLMHRLQEARVPFLIGGTYACECYTGLPRRTKDLDLFLRKSDFPRAMKVAEAGGYRTENTAPHWLGKIFQDGDFIDVIYSSGNKVCHVDDDWFAHAVEDTVLGVPVLLCPVEEQVWSKAFIMERERFDGADVIHLLHARAEQLDWARLLSRFGAYWRVLLSHLVLLEFVYPNENVVPRAVLATLARRLTDEEPERELLPAEKVCYGTILSRTQYHIDVGHWGYQDMRLLPPVSMTSEELEIWNHVK
jgi:hypothetical protein